MQKINQEENEMAELALVPKENGIIEKYGLCVGTLIPPLKENVIFKDSFSFIKSSSLGIESIALDDIRNERVEIIYPKLYTFSLTQTNPKTFFGRDWAGRLNIKMRVPTFAVYSLDSPYCEFWFEDIHGTKKGFTAPKGLPQILSCSLLKKVGPLDKRHEIRKTHFISIFKGLIPSGVKKEIKEATQYFDQIYILGEAKWCVENPTPEKDPLVIGILNDSCYLISEFDTTPIEKLAKNYK